MVLNGQDGCPYSWVGEAGHHDSPEVTVHPVQVPAVGVDGQDPRGADGGVNEHLHPRAIQEGPLDRRWDRWWGLDVLLCPVHPVTHHIVGNVVGISIFYRYGNQIINVGERGVLPKVKGQDPDL